MGVQTLKWLECFSRLAPSRAYVANLILRGRYPCHLEGESLGGDWEESHQENGKGFVIKTGSH